MSAPTSEEILSLGKEYALGSRQHRKNLSKSVECFQKAEEMGNIRGRFRHALSVFEGEGVTKDRNTAQKMASGIIPQLIVEAKENKIKSIQILADAILLLYPRARPLRDYRPPESLRSVQDLGFFDEIITLLAHE